MYSERPSHNAAPDIALGAGPPGQHPGRPAAVHLADQRPRGEGVRLAARLHLGLPGAWRRHHARHRAAGAARMESPRLVIITVAAVPVHKRADIADVRPRKGAFVCAVRPRCTQSAPFPPLNALKGSFVCGGAAAREPPRLDPASPIRCRVLGRCSCLVRRCGAAAGRGQCRRCRRRRQCRPNCDHPAHVRDGRRSRRCRGPRAR